ncbi:hypothetical protein Ahy_B07g088797 [Arachis hypogaea]|uniref:Aminotransferase-like plant mobile domain-containing protein n=1 Tax=Arachis hypogaea TaxID=3818 RepID=A0A444YFH4_ARAHY|nr:hypothetical protein Ahy_B07g088797 [Arachis hypogaea]
MWFQEQLGVSPHANCNDKFTMRCSWMQDTFGEIPDGADDATIRRYARAYIVMLLGTLLFSDKSGTLLHIQWLPYVAKFEDIDGPAEYDTFGRPLALRSAAKDGEATNITLGVITGTDDEAPPSLELEQAAVAGAWGARFEPLELETTPISLANSSRVLTSGNCQ